MFCIYIINRVIHLASIYSSAAGSLGGIVDNSNILNFLPLVVRIFVNLVKNQAVWTLSYNATFKNLSTKFKYFSYLMFNRHAVFRWVP